MASTAIESTSTDIAYPRTGKRGVPQQFPRRLYKMLQAESSPGPERTAGKVGEIIITWSESGRAFRIADASSFSSLILPKYFRTSKFSSFQRNLNLYGFSKVRRGPDTDMYAHPAFLRGHPELLSQLKKSANTSGKNRGACTTNSTTSKSHKLKDALIKGRKQQQEEQRDGSPSTTPQLYQHVLTQPATPPKTADVLTLGSTRRMVSPTTSQDELMHAQYYADNNSEVVTYRTSSNQHNFQTQTQIEPSSLTTNNICQFSAYTTSTQPGSGVYPTTPTPVLSPSNNQVALTNISSPSTVPTTSMLPNNSHGKLDLLTIAMTCLAEQECPSV